MPTLAVRLRTPFLRLLVAALVVLLGPSWARAQHLAGSFPVGSGASLMVADPAARQVWTANGDATLTVVDGSYPVPVTSTIPLMPASATALAVDPVRHLVYVGCSDGSLRVFDEGDYSNPMPAFLLNAPGGGGGGGLPGGGTPGSSETSGNPLVALAVDPVAGRVFAVDDTTNTVWVCPSDGAGSASQAVTLPAGPHSLAVNPVTGRAYVTNRSPASLSALTFDAAGSAALSTTDLSGTCWGIAVDPIHNTIYVTDPDDLQVQVLDGNTFTLTTNIVVLNNPTDLAFNPLDGKIYGCGTSGQMTIIDPGAGNSVTTVTVGSGPNGIAINPVTGWVYVSNRGANTLSCLDGTYPYHNGDVVASLDLADGRLFAPGPVAVDPVTGRIYVLQLNTTDGQHGIAVVDGATNRSNAWTLGATASAVRLDPAGGRFYVANTSVGGLDTLDAADPSLPPGSLAAGSADALALDPATGLLFLGLETAGTVQIVDPSGAAATSTLQVTAAVASPPTGQRPDRIAADPLTGRVFVANTAASTVAILDSAGSGGLLATVQVGTGPWAVAVDPDLRQAYVTDSGSGTVSVLRTGDPLAPVRTVSVGAGPRAVAVDPSTHQVFVANWDDGTVSIFDGDLGTGPVVATAVAVGGHPSALAVDPDRSLVYVASQDDGTLTILQARYPSAPSVTLAVAGAPQALAVDPLRNKIYVVDAGAGPGLSRVVVVDGATQAVTSTINAAPGIAALAVDPRSGMVAAVNGSDGPSSLIQPDSYLSMALGIATRLDGASDQDHLPAVRTLSPGFTFTVTSAPELPAPLYLRLLGSDGALGAPATGGSQGDNPRTFTGTVGHGQHGLHTLYLVSGYGLDGTTACQPTQGASSPWIGRAQAVPYLLLPRETSLILVSDANPAPADGPTTLTATVTATAGGSSNPTGMVRFYDAGSSPTLLAEVPLAADPDPAVGTATFQVTGLEPGDHTLAATYEGDPACAPSTGSLTLTLTSGPGSGAADLVLLSGDNQTATVGTAFAQPLVVQVLDASGRPLAGVPVTFTSTGLSFVPNPAISGSDGRAATVATPAVAQVFNVNARAGSALVVTFHLTGVAVADRPTPTVLLSVPGTLAPGQPFQVSVRVSGDGTGPVPTGLVDLRKADGTHYSLTLDPQGQASLPMTFDGITTSFTAHYEGDGAYGPADSDRADLAAARTATVIALTVPPAPAFGKAVTLTAQVTPADGGTALIPAGTVQFLADGQELGRAELDPAGTATLTTRLLPSGQPVLAASYLGSSACLPCQSPGAAVPVGAGLLLSPQTPSVPPIPAGSPVSFTFTLRTQDLPSDRVISLSAANLPVGARATFTPEQLRGGSLLSTLRMDVTTTPPDTPDPFATAGLAGAGGGGLLACGLLAFPFGRRRRRLLGFLGLLALAALGGLQGCTSSHRGSTAATPPGTYTIDVRASAPGVEPTVTQVTFTVIDPAAP